MLHHQDAYNLQNSDEPVMHTITSTNDFDIDGNREGLEPQKKSRRMFGGPSKKKKSQAFFDETYHQKMTFTLTEDQEVAKATLARMGHKSEVFEKKRNCCQLWTCKGMVWREYMKQNRNGFKWLWTLLSIQILYIFSYLVLEFVRDRENLTPYQYFNMIITVWLILFAIFFLRNAVSRMLIEELKITLVTLTIMSVYSIILFTISCINIYNSDIWLGQDVDDHLARIIFIIDLVGVGINFIILPLFYYITYLVYQDMREFIIFHLDGNRIMWQNFQNVTMTRGILKLDVLANLEYFSCFSMILFRDEIAPNIPIWCTIGALFIITCLIQAFGGYGTIVTASNCRYRSYFTMRFIIEFIKLGIIIAIPITGRILWEEIKFKHDLSRDQLTFLIFSSLSLIFTIGTTSWSTYRIRQAQILRKKNQSEQIKAMWRVEETHFNTNMNMDPIMRSTHNDKSALILKRIIKTME